MELISTLLGGLGLAAAAGLNAYIPLLVMGLADHLLPDRWFHLAAPFDFIGQPWFLAVVALLLLIETLADKIPVVDHVNDIIQTLIRPTAGAVLFASSTGAMGHLDPRLALVLGFLTAGSIHGVKAAVRPIVTAATGGLGNPIVSFVEDVISFVTALVAILLPLAVLALLVGVPFMVWRWTRRRRVTEA